MSQGLRIHIVYADKDESYLTELAAVMSGLNIKRSAELSVEKISSPESKHATLMRNEVRKADVIFYLLSPDFLSLFPFSEHLAASGALHVPIILKECKWQETHFAKMQVLPRSLKPVTSFTNRDQAFREINEEIILFEQEIKKDPKWLKLIEAENKSRTGVLDLKDCNLTSVPAELKDMYWLERIDLSFNQITVFEGWKDFNSLHQFALLTLNLSNNQISTVSGLDNLGKLKQLNLSANKIERIQGLDNLKELYKLDLSQNQLRKIEGLDSKNKLGHLNLSSNQISVIEGLDGLKKLKHLNLSTNKISAIDNLGHLEKLNELFLSSNQITAINGLNNLAGLTLLSLFDNRLTRIDGLNTLAALKELSLSRNQIGTIEGLENLFSLTKLYLSHNQITKVQGLAAFPPKLEELCLYDNPIENIALTIFGSKEDDNCIGQLKSLFAEEVEINVPEVKLILTGNSDVGKTKFLEYFESGKFSNTRNSTHGLEVHPYTLKKEIMDKYGFEKETKINVWDFGGQEYFHNTHQLFFNQHAVYIFLWERDTNKNEPITTEINNDGQGRIVSRVLEHFDETYWLSNIRHFASEAAIIIIQNKADKYEQKNEPVEWLSHGILKKFGCSKQYAVSLLEASRQNLHYWYDFEKLRHAVFSELKAFVSKNQEGNIYNRVRKEIEKLKDVNYWRTEDFILFIEKQKSVSSSATVNDIDNRLVIEHFNQQGKVLYPKRQPLEAGKLIFTNPQWVSSKIYEILNDAVLQRNGYFDEGDLARLVENKLFESRDILDQVIELMSDYNIVFQNKNKKQFIAPQYLPEVPTIHYSQVKKLLAVPKIIIRVDGFLPKSVINNIIAKHAIKDDAANLYKYGVKTGSAKDILLIEADYSLKKIFVYTDATDAEFIRGVFADILLEFEITLEDNASAMKTTMTNPRNYQLFISIDDKVFVNWVNLWNDYRGTDMDRDYIAADDGNMVLRKMYDIYRLPFKELKNISINNQLKPCKLFISYSSKNTDFMKRLVIHLEPLKRNATIDLWYDRMIEPGTKWDDTIKDEMRNADLIVFLLSPDFIATSYIFEFEIPQAIKQMESNNSKLFFVELQSCSWNRTVLARFQQTTNPSDGNKGVIIIEEPMKDDKWKEVVAQLEIKIAGRRS